MGGGVVNFFPGAGFPILCAFCQDPGETCIIYRTTAIYSLYISITNPGDGYRHTTDHYIPESSPRARDIRRTAYYTRPAARDLNAIGPGLLQPGTRASGAPGSGLVMTQPAPGECGPIVAGLFRVCRPRAGDVRRSDFYRGQKI